MESAQYSAGDGFGRHDLLARYPFYYAALGELELSRGRRGIAREHFERAVALGRNPMERQFLKRRVDACT